MTKSYWFLAILLICSGVTFANENIVAMHDKAKIYYQAAGSFSEDSYGCLQDVKREGRDAMISSDCDSARRYAKNQAIQIAFIKVIETAQDLSPEEKKTAWEDFVISDFVRNYQKALDNMTDIIALIR